MNKLDLDYQRLLRDILKNGVKKSDRTGTGTLSVFGRQIRHSMADGFPLLTTKKMAWKSIVTELLWFLRGDTNIKYLVDNDCHIWDGDAYRFYVEHHLKGITVKSGNLNYDQSGRAYPDNPEISENWKCIWKNKNEYYNIVGMPFHAEWSSMFLSQQEFINKIKTDDEFAREWGELGRVYGAQWRNWNSEVPFGEATSSLDVGIDQIANLINDLKNDPDSRRLLVTAWNPADVPNSVLPPCHYGFQVWTRELSVDERSDLYTKKYGTDEAWLRYGMNEDFYDDTYIPKRAISLMWSQRSVDTFLGLPFNIASYGLLLEIIANEVNMVPDELIGNLGDVHLYSNHIEQAEEQLSRTPFNLPALRVKQSSNDEPTAVVAPEYWHPADFVIENYQSHPAIKAPLSN